MADGIAMKRNNEDNINISLPHITSPIKGWNTVTQVSLKSSSSPRLPFSAQLSHNTPG